MPLLSINGTRLHVEDSGPAASGTTVLFSHGLLWNTRLFDHQVSALKARYRCIAWDHRGQGQSADSDLPSIDMDLLYEDAVALIEQLNLGPVHFCGLSMGGFVGLRLAARRPDLVRSLSLLDTAARAETPKRVILYRRLNLAARWLGTWAVVDRVMPILFARSVLADPARAAEVAAWRQVVLGSRRSIWRAVNGVIGRAGVEAELDQITAPCQVLVGEEDVATPLEDAEVLARRLRSSRLVVVPRAGHSSPVEQPVLVTAALTGFLEGVS